MRFLADQGISPLIVAHLRGGGHDAVHVRDLGLGRAPDGVILDRAEQENRVVLTEDVGFGTLLVPVGRSKPSVILFRDSGGRTPARIRLLSRHLEEIEESLDRGSIVIMEDAAIRVRRLFRLGGDP